MPACSGVVEAAGLVRRTSCPADRRASYAQLTEAGLDALRRATEVHLVSLQRHFVDPLGAAASPRSPRPCAGCATSTSASPRADSRSGRDQRRRPRGVSRAVGRAGAGSRPPG